MGILPQTQGARRIYEEKIHPWLEENETQIDDFIASAHERLTAAGIAYLKLAIEQFKTKVLGLPPSEQASPPPEPAQSYTQSLLSRFSVPAARWTGDANNSTVIPPHLRDSNERMTFISAQRDRLNILLTALDREAQDLRSETQRAQTRAAHRRAPSMSYDGTEDDEPTQRPPSGLSGWSGMSKSRSETDFERIDAESGTEDDGTVRRRNMG